MDWSRRCFLKQSFVLAAAGCGSRLWAAGDAPNDWKDRLSRHRVAWLEVKSVQLDWPRQVGKNSRLDVHGRGQRETVCRIVTDKGAVGWGAFLSRPQEAMEILSRVKGQAITDLFDPTVGVIKQEALPLDLALHDLAGVILEIPVYKMLGHAGPEANVCYSGMIYFDDLEPKEKPAGIGKVLENCQWDYEYGYRQFKVKIGRGNRWMEKQAGIARDVEVTKRIAAAFPDADILVDGNDGFTGNEFLAYLEGIGDVPLFWIEEPFPETREDYRALRERMAPWRKKTLLADGEYNPNVEFITELLKEGLIDVCLYDVCGYGFTAWRKLLPLMKAMGVTTSPHAWGSKLKTHYIAHLATGLGNVVTIEGVTCSSKDVDFGDYPMKNGKLVTSSAPGFGMKLI